MSPKNWLKFIVLGLVWGSSFMWIKIAVQEIGPITLVAFRISFAAAGLLLVMLWRRAKLPPRSYLKAFAVIGLINIALPFVLISWSEQYIPSALASILNSTVPLFTTLIAHFFISDDRLTSSKMIGLVIGFLGVVLLLSDKLNGGLHSSLIGPAAMLLAAVCYAAATVYARRTTQGLTPDVQAFGQQAMALVYILPTMLIFETPFRPPHLPITWLGLAWLGLLGTAFATLLYYSLLHTVGPTRTSLVSYIFPLVGVVLGIIFLGETPGWQFFAGGALVIGGIIVVNRKRR